MHKHILSLRDLGKSPYAKCSNFQLPIKHDSHVAKTFIVTGNNQFSL